MKLNYLDIILLILSMIFIFVIGVMFEIDYRILTRNTIKYFSRIGLDFYGGKDFRIFETDIAIILTLIPISIFLLLKNLKSFIIKGLLIFFYLINLLIFYSLYCFIESELIQISITNQTFINDSLMYHSNNINYRSILLFVIFSTFFTSMLIKRLITKTKEIK